MTSIQGILVACCLLGAALGNVVFGAKLAYRLLAVVVGLVAMVFVLFPNLATAIAHAVGVGRGADLLSYLWLIAGVYAILVLYQHIRELERKVTELVRAIAVRDAERTATR
jgi:hypothetical protein